MDIKIENDIRLLKKLGLDDTNATIIACNQNGKPEMAEQAVEMERLNSKILQEETLKYLVPFETTLTKEESKIIFHDVAMNAIVVSEK